MKKTWIYKKIDNESGKEYWTLHFGIVWFNKYFINFGYDAVTSKKEVMEKWKEFYNAEVYVSKKHKNKEVKK